MSTSFAGFGTYEVTSGSFDGVAGEYLAVSSALIPPPTGGVDRYRLYPVHVYRLYPTITNRLFPVT